MACGSCAAAAQNRIQRIQRQASNNTPSQECQFNITLLQNWERRLNCIKENELFEEVKTTLHEINGYLGVIKSAMSNSNNICYFESHLNSISPLIVRIINLGQC